MGDKMREAFNRWRPNDSASRERDLKIAWEAFQAGHDAGRQLGIEQAKREPLTRAQIRECSAEAQVSFCLDKAPTYEVAFAREVERLHGIPTPPAGDSDTP